MSTATVPVQLYHAQVSGYPMADALVVHDRADWEAAWAQVHNGMVPPPLPAVDFARDAVVIVAAGARNAGGTEIRVTEVVPQGHDVVVHYTVTEPGAGCMRSMALTSPVDIVRVPRTPGAVRFEATTARPPC